MTQRDTLQCVHEPLGDAFYYGPERMSSRFEQDEQTRAQSGFSASTYQSILDRIEREGEEVCPAVLSPTSMLLLGDCRSSTISGRLHISPRSRQAVGYGRVASHNDVAMYYARRLYGTARCCIEVELARWHAVESDDTLRWHH